jgi:hypothetical protein
MKEFMLLFRQPNFDHSKTSPKEMQAISNRWKEWVEGIASQGKLSMQGSRLSIEGKVLKPGGVVTDGPFVEIKERLGGYIVVKAENIDDAVTLSHGCPTLDADGSVEIRPLYS